jgi:tRNA dimethylallyltransferase
VRAGALLCLTGPTAAGKTALAIELAEALDGELISVDSALVYRGLDIGAAKPDYPHHLIDICDPGEAYSAARFCADARAAIAAVRGRGRRPILVGGTMLYFRALIDGLSPLPAADPALRRAIEAEAAEHGWPHIHAQLAALDPEAAARIHPRHSQRLARALEVCRASGRPLSELQRRPGAGLGEPLLCVALAPRDRALLHRRIADRFAAMMDAGFLDEVRALHGRGDLHPALPAVRAVGYRQLWEYLDGRCGFEEAVERGVVATRQLAKRQFTWLRKWPDLHWLLTGSDGDLLEQDLLPGKKLRNPAQLILNYLAQDPMV